MSIDKKTTNEITNKFRLHEKDTGSADIQIAILSEKITVLGERLKNFPCSDLRLELLRTIGTRRKLLNYLNSTDTKRYLSLISRLHLKK